MIYFDARLLSQNYGGLATFTTGLLKEVLEHSSPSHVKVILNENQDYDVVKEIDELVRAAIERGFVVYTNVEPFSLKNQTRMLSWLRSNLGDEDTYFYPHFNFPIGFRGRVKLVIHDAIPLTVPGYFRSFTRVKKTIYRFFLILAFLRKYYEIFVPTEATAMDLRRFFGRSARKQEIVVCGEGFTPLSTVECTQVEEVSKHPYFLYVGDMRPHKDVERLVKTVEFYNQEFDQRHKVVICGDPNEFTQTAGWAKEQKEVLHIGFRSDNERNWLYQNADAFITMSKYEGFGLPVLEAGSFGKMILFNDGGGALREIAPEWAVPVAQNATTRETAAQLNELMSRKMKIDGEMIEIYLGNFSWHRTYVAIFQS